MVAMKVPLLEYCSVEKKVKIKVEMLASLTGCKAAE